MKISTEFREDQIKDLNHRRMLLKTSKGNEYRVTECSDTGGLIICKVNYTDHGIGKFEDLKIEPRTSNNIKVI